MQKIEFKDLPDTTTPLSANNLNTLQDNVEDAIEEVRTELKDYAVATINNAQTISSGYQVNLNSMARSHGNFTLENGAIVIGEGINRIRVSGSMFIESWAGSSNYLWGRIQKNNTSISSSITGSTSSYLSASIPVTIIDVQEGDTIKLIADAVAGGNLRTGSANTWLCVEKVD